MVRGKLAFGVSLASALCMFGVGASAAATLINLDETINDGPPKPLTMVLDADRLRITSPSVDMIFRGDQNVVWILTQKDHRYMEMTAAGMAAMGAKVDQAMAQMKQKLAAVPEAQRKQIEAMMASHGLGQDKASAAPELVYEKAGDSRKVGEWDCAPYRILLGAKPISDVCVAKLSDVGLSKDDLKVFLSLSAFSAHMRSAAGGLASSMAAMDYASMTKAIGFDGFPVQTSTQSLNQSRHIVTTLKSVQHEDAPAGAFDLPVGYKKREMGGL
jgi:hypothetical protein